MLKKKKIVDLTDERCALLSIPVSNLYVNIGELYFVPSIINFVKY